MPRRRTSKKNTLAGFTKKVVTRNRRRTNAALVGNPPWGQDLMELILPGIAAYASVRVAGRIACKLGNRKSKKLGKHLSPLCAILVAAGEWLAVHKIQRLKQYHAGVVIGSSIAAAQTVLQTYVPQYSWILNDYHLDEVNAKLAGKKTPNGLPAAAQDSLPEPTAAEDDYGDLDLPLEELNIPELDEGGEGSLAPSWN